LHPSLNVTKFIVDGCLERNPQNSLLTPWFFEEICRFWAEFGDFGMDSKKNLQFSPFLVWLGWIFPQFLNAGLDLDLKSSGLNS